MLENYHVFLMIDKLYFCEKFLEVYAVSYTMQLSLVGRLLMFTLRALYIHEK